MIPKFFYRRWIRYGIRAFLWGGILWIMLLVKNSFYHLPPHVWTAAGSELCRPVFFSLTQKGQPFKVWGDKAYPVGEAKYGLNQPRADLQGPHPMRIQGNQGLYDKEGALMQLSGNVSVSSQGHAIFTPRALMNFRAKDIQGSDPVWGQSPWGKFKAQGFSLNKGCLILKGPVTLNMVSQPSLSLFEPSLQREKSKKRKAGPQEERVFKGK